MNRRRQGAALAAAGVVISSSALLLATRHSDHGVGFSPAFFAGLAVGVGAGLLMLAARRLITGRRPDCR